jgi:hypothetical protein
MGPVQMDTNLFINNTISFVGSYEHPVKNAKTSPKVASLTSAVSLHAVAVFTNSIINIKLVDLTTRLERMDKEDWRECAKAQEEMWIRTESLLINALEKFEA